MTPSRFWVTYGCVVLAVTAGLLLLTVVEPALWWPIWLLTLLAVVAGTSLLVQFHHQQPLRLPTLPELRHWIAPLALAAGGALFVQQFLGGRYGTGGAIAIAFGVGAVMYFQAALADPHPHELEHIRLLSNLSVYISAFLLFAALQSLAPPPPWGVLIMALLAGLLSSELFHDREVPVARQALYTFLVMVLIGELAWTLSYLPWGKILIGLILLLAFYPLSELIHNHLLARLTPRVALEFAAVALVGLALVYTFQGFRA